MNGANERPSSFPLRWPTGKERTASYRRERGFFGKVKYTKRDDGSEGAAADLNLALERALEVLPA